MGGYDPAPAKRCATHHFRDRFQRPLSIKQRVERVLLASIRPPRAGGHRGGDRHRAGRAPWGCWAPKAGLALATTQTSGHAEGEASLRPANCPSH